MLLPGGAEFDRSREDAELGALVGGIFDAGDAGLDVEGEGADRAGEAVFSGGEGADGSHCRIPFAVSGHSIAASMAVAKAGDDRTAPEGPKLREGRRGEPFLFRDE